MKGKLLVSREIINALKSAGIDDITIQYSIEHLNEDHVYTDINGQFLPDEAMVDHMRRAIGELSANIRLLQSELKKYLGDIKFIMLMDFDHMEWLNEQAEKRGMHKSQVIRELINSAKYEQQNEQA